MKHIVLLGLMALFLAGCDAPQKPEFRRMESVKFTSVKFNGPAAVIVSADAVFFNPNSIGATVTEVDVDLMIGDKKVTRIKQDVTTEMTGQSEFILPLTFDVPLKEVFDDIKPSINDIFQKRKVNYRLEGNIKVGLGSVEFKVPVTYEDEEEIKLSL